MNKEIIIGSIIFIIVIVSNILMYKYTENNISDFNEDLQYLFNILEGDNKEIIKQSATGLKDKWYRIYNKFAFYLEHDELEKVEESIVEINENINEEDYQNAKVEIKKCEFLLDHIKEKSKLNMKNIF